MAAAAEPVTLGGKKLPTAHCVELLGRLLQGDGSCDRDIDRRCLLARRRYNDMKALWHDSEVGLELKLRLLLRDVYSILSWANESWLLTSDVQKRLNGWSSRCLAPITGKSHHEEASPRTQTIGIVGVFRYRRMAYLAHLLRADPIDPTRRDVLRYFQMTHVLKWFDDDGGITMDAPAASNVEELIWMAGGSGTADDRTINRKRWAGWAKEKLSPADRKRMAAKPAPASSKQRIPANTPAETAEKLLQINHRYRIYTDGGCTGNGRKGDWGVAGWGATVFTAVDDNTESAGAEEADYVHQFGRQMGVTS